MQPVLRVDDGSIQNAAASYYQLGKHHQKLGRDDLASAAYASSIALDGRQLDARNALAVLDLLQGRPEQAKTALQQVIADYPAVAHSYNNLGYVYYFQGDYAKAISTLRHSLALDPKNEHARNNLALAVTAAKGTAGHSGDSGTTAPAEIAGTAVASHRAIAVSAPRARMELQQIKANIYRLAPSTTVPSAAGELQPEQGTINAVAGARIVKIDIIDGVAGMAGAIRQMLERHGMPVRRISKQRRHMTRLTEIQYRTGYVQEAGRVKAALSIDAVLTPVRRMPGEAQVRLVLGKDAVDRMGWIDDLDSAAPVNEASN